MTERVESPTSATIADTSEQPATRGILRMLALMGPAFVAGAWQFGPGNLTTAVQAGSGYLYTLIWVIVVSTILMIFLTDMRVRLVIRSPSSLLAASKDDLATRACVAPLAVAEPRLPCFSVGNAVGSGLGISLLVGGSPVMWSVIATIAVGALFLLRNVYQAVERVLVVIVALMAVAFIASTFAARPDWGAAAAGLIPTIPEGSTLLIVALVGTNLSCNAAFFTAYGTREHARTERDYRDLTIADTIPGIVAPGIMTALVIAVAAAALGAAGKPVTSIVGLAQVFEPLAGALGAKIFALGFLGAAFSSMVANATAGGIMLSDGLGRGSSAGSPTAKIVAGAILAFGIGVTLAFQSSPVQLIVVAQALTVFVAPILAALIILMANRARLMGALKNTWWQNVFGGLALLSVVALSVRLFSTLFLT